MSDKQPFEFFPAAAIHKLQFPEILKRVGKYCIGEEGREHVEALLPQTHARTIETELQKVEEFRKLLISSDKLIFNYLPPVNRLLNALQAGTPWLAAEELFTLLRWLRTLKVVLVFFEKNAAAYPVLAQLYGGKSQELKLIQRMEQVLNDEGQVRPNATPLLTKLRSQAAEVSAMLRNRMQQLLKDARANGYTDERELTIRNQRLVLPIKTDFKGRVKGLIHDLSGSGQTVFIEPLEAVPMNNELREIYLREQNEILRLLTELTDELRPLVPVLRPAAQYLAEIDSLRARASFALQTESFKPQIDPHSRDLNIVDARHPLLLLEKGKNGVVPLNVKLDSVRRILLISGPNAGGKSVALQTVGLMSLLAQSGLLVPASTETVLPVIRRIFVDLGDDQSIQNDLSTYSSHLTLMQTVYEKYEGRSLLLLDEFGAGTDPQLGGAMAEVLLEEFASRRGFGVINTHYSNLKELAERLPALVNGAMQFDLATISPLYRLEQGLPGSSFAFEIAQRVGIPDNLLRKARERTGNERAQSESLLQNLKQQLQDTEKDRRKLAKLIETNEETERKLKHAEREIRERKDAVLKKAREAAHRLLVDAQKRIDETIEEVRAVNAERNTTLRLRKQLDAVLHQAVENEPDLAPSEAEIEEMAQYQVVDSGPFYVNDEVKIVSTQAVGRIISINKRKSVVQIGDFRMTVPLDELMRVKPFVVEEEKPIFIPKSNIREFIASDKVSQTADKLDVRGFRVEQAIHAVEDFMDQLIMGGATQAVILHGKGTGALRMALRMYLRQTFSQISEITDAPDNQGGSGITLCKLNYARMA